MLWIFSVNKHARPSFIQKFRNTFAYEMTNSRDATEINNIQVFNGSQLLEENYFFSGKKLLKSSQWKCSGILILSIA